MMLYLATPYTDSDPAIRYERYRAACEATARLMLSEHVVFSPIVHSHALVAHGCPMGWEFWQRQAQGTLRRCDSLLVLGLDGWEESVGVQAEIRWAQQWGKWITHAAPGELERLIASGAMKTGAGDA